MPQDDALIAELTSPTYGQQVLGVEASGFTAEGEAHSGMIG